MPGPSLMLTLSFLPQPQQLCEARSHEAKVLCIKQHFSTPLRATTLNPFTALQLQSSALKVQSFS